MEVRQFAFALLREVLFLVPCCSMDCWCLPGGSSLFFVHGVAGLLGGLLDCWCLAGGSSGLLVPRWGKFFNYSCWFVGCHLFSLVLRSDTRESGATSNFFSPFPRSAMRSDTRASGATSNFFSIFARRTFCGRTLRGQVRLAVPFFPRLGFIFFAVGHSGVGCD